MDSYELVQDVGNAGHSYARGASELLATNDELVSSHFEGAEITRSISTCLIVWVR